MGLDSSKKNKKISMLLAFLLSSITGLVGIMLWFTLRETLMVVITVSDISVWSHSAIDNFSFLLLGIGWLVLVYFSQYFYQKGYRQGKLIANFSLITGLQVLFFFICKLIMLTIGFTTGIGQVFTAGIEALIGIGLLVYAFKGRGKSIDTGKSVTS